MPNAAESVTAYSKHNVQKFPLELTNLPFWLLWQAKYDESRGKVIKPPVSKAWQTTRVKFDQLSPLPGQSYGFIYCDEHPYICIDIDSESESNQELLSKLQAYKPYIERSPSGIGTHVILAVSDKPTLLRWFSRAVHSDQKRDLYISSGYVTMTGDCDDVPAAIPSCSIADMVTLLTPYFNTTSSEPVTQPQLSLVRPDSALSNAQYTQQQISTALEALPVKYLTDDSFTNFKPLNHFADPPPESRDAWLKVGMALHAIANGAPVHLAAWRDWSMQGDKYDDAALTACWHSFGSTSCGGSPSTDSRRCITFASVMMLAKAQRPEFKDLNAKKIPTATLENLEVFLDFLKVEARYNVVESKVEVLIPQSHYLATHDNVTSLPTAVTLLDNAFIRMCPSNAPKLSKYLDTLLNERALKVQYNPIVEYFKNEIPQWDYHSRLPELMATIGCAEEYKQVYEDIIRAWMIQVMAAVFTTPEDPHILNTMLILEGAQGIGKTRWITSLFPPDLTKFCVASKSVSISQFRNDMVKLTMELAHTLICSIDEADQVFSERTASEFKSFLDKTADTVVLPYGRTALSILRRTVFIGSTNQRRFLRDTTGNRRVFVLAIKSLDFRHEIDVTQLWAEILHYYNRNEAWYFEYNSSSSTNRNRKRAPHDPARNAAVVAYQMRYNADALDTTDEGLVEQLNSMFDGDAPLNQWSFWTLSNVLNILGLSTTHKANTRSYKQARNTLIYWVKAVAEQQTSVKSALAALIKEPKRQSQNREFLMPPLRTE